MNVRNIKDYIRVTDVLFPLSGLKSIDPQILANAARRGTLVHNAIDAIISGLGISEEANNAYVESFLRWSEGKAFEQKPGRFFCDELRITGECDAIYKDGQDLILVDFKTPAKESKTWKLQGSAYSHLAKKCGHNISRIEFVKLSKMGAPPTIYTYEEDFELFKKCLDVYKIFFIHQTEENPLDLL